MSARASRRALDFASVALVALGLAPPGVHALAPALLAVALQAFVRRREGRALGATLVALTALFAAGVHAQWQRSDAVSEALTFGALVALLGAVVFGPTRGAPAELIASCRSRARLRRVARAPTVRPVRRIGSRPAGT